MRSCSPFALMWLLAVWTPATEASDAPTVRRAHGVLNPSKDTVLTTLVCRPLSPNEAELKLVLFGLGRDMGLRPEARVEFVPDGTPGKRIESAAPGPRTVRVPLKPERWSKGHVKVVPVGTFVFDRSTPTSLRVHAGLGAAGELPHVGTIERDGKGHIAFRRRGPWPALEDRDKRVLVAVTAKRLGPRRFFLKLGYFNCGERFDKDLSAFIHFEFAAQGEHLANPIAMKLLPAGRKVDSSAWSLDAVTIVRLHPFTIPRDAPRHVYVRAGLYDQFGTGARVRLAGSDDGTGRVLVGRFVNAPDRVEFERLPPPESSGRVE